MNDERNRACFAFHPERREDCPVCRQYATDERYRTAQEPILVRPASPSGPGMVAPPRAVYLGDRVEQALSAVGITKERVAQWLGSCGGCGQRQQKLNELDQWSREALAGGVDRARAWLGKLLGG